MYRQQGSALLLILVFSLLLTLIVQQLLIATALHGQLVQQQRSRLQGFWRAHSLINQVFQHNQSRFSLRTSQPYTLCSVNLICDENSLIVPQLKQDEVVSAAAQFRYQHLRSNHWSLLLNFHDEKMDYQIEIGFAVPVVLDESIKDDEGDWRFY
jgi:hypothetical protein